MYPGQGSQYFHMGKSLYRQHPRFQHWLNKLDAIAGALIGSSVIGHMYDPDRNISDPYNRTLFSHPAIFMIEYAISQILVENGIYPDFLIGASLGEFTAAAVSGMLPLEKALEAVIAQARIFEQTCPEGGMTAILHDVELFYQDAVLYENVELAGISLPGHFVISGTMENMKKALSHLRKKNILWHPLPVSFGFNSKAIQAGRERYLEYAQGLNLRLPQIPTMSSLLATELTTVPDAYFWNIARQEIKFQETILSQADW